jgi:hypothetical protein
MVDKNGKKWSTMSVKYTHRDKDGMLWRFNGGRPVSKLADDVMRKVGFVSDGKGVWKEKKAKK